MVPVLVVDCILSVVPILVVNGSHEHVVAGSVTLLVVPGIDTPRVVDCILSVVPVLVDCILLVVLVPRGNIGSHAHVVVGSVLSLVVLGIVTP